MIFLGPLSKLWWSEASCIFSWFISAQECTVSVKKRLILVSVWFTLFTSSSQPHTQFKSQITWVEREFADISVKVRSLFFLLPPAFLWALLSLSVSKGRGVLGHATNSALSASRSRWLFLLIITSSLYSQRKNLCVLKHHCIFSSVGGEVGEHREGKSAKHNGTGWAFKCPPDGNRFFVCSFSHLFVLLGVQYCSL